MIQYRTLHGIMNHGVHKLLGAGIKHKGAAEKPVHQVGYTDLWHHTSDVQPLQRLLEGAEFCGFQSLNLKIREWERRLYINCGARRCVQQVHVPVERTQGRVVSNQWISGQNSAHHILVFGCPLAYYRYAWSGGPCDTSFQFPRAAKINGTQSAGYIFIRL